MYQILYYSWRCGHPTQNQSLSQRKSSYNTNLEQIKSKLDMPSNDNVIKVIVNNELIKSIDQNIEYSEKYIISWFSCM